MSRGYQASLVKIPAKPFISTWNTATTYTGSTANNQIKLPLIATGTYKFTVQWGDNTSSVITTWNQAEVTHTYPAPGVYTVTITGFIKGWDFANFVIAAALTGDRRKITSITQFGCLRLVTYTNTIAFSTILSGAFYGCTNLNLSSVLDQPNFKNTTSIQGFLRDCPQFTTVPNINKWDVSKIKYFRDVFRNSINFNDNVGNWNMYSATDINNIFATATGFGKFNNGGSNTIKNWDVSNVTDFGYVFAYQKEFNQEVGLWNVSKGNIFTYMFGIGINASADNFGKFTNAGSDSIKNWNFAGLTGPFALYSMFYGQKDFNVDLGNWDVSKNDDFRFMFGASPLVGMAFNNGGSPSIGNWNTSSGLQFSYMFVSSNKFNQNIGAWNMSKATNMIYMFGSLSPMSIPMIFNNGGSPDINNWNTSLVVDMRTVFRNNLGFNQSVGNWNVSNVTAFTQFLENSGISVENYSNTLIGWASRPVIPNRSINNAPLKYNSSAIAARAILTSAPNNWTISDGGLQP